MMRFEGRVALVTGANRGMGSVFVRELIASGMRRVYAASRRPEEVDVLDSRVVPVRLDLDDRESIAAAAATAIDVDLLVNNAGISTFTPILADEARVRREFDVNVFGTLAVCRQFAPGLAARGGGAILTVLSALSWYVMEGNAAYSAAKSALWAVTNALRLELRAQGTSVVAVHCGLVDTAMSAQLDVPKAAPEDVVRQALQAVEVGAHEVLTDEYSRRARARVSGPLEAQYRALRAARVES